MLKPSVPKFRYDLSVRLRDITEKRVPAKPKPIVVSTQATAFRPFPSHYTTRGGRSLCVAISWLHVNGAAGTAADLRVYQPAERPTTDIVETCTCVEKLVGR